MLLVLYMAHLLAADPGRVLRFKQGLWPLLFVYALSAGLLLAEPDFGTAFISGMVFFGMIFLAGIPLGWISALVAAAVPAALAGVIMAPYRFRRVTSFLDPWDDPSDSDFQLVQSLLSFGNGGLHGTGLGEGQQKQFYLPESHTDFIFAVIGEEMGLIWVLIIIALFATLIWRSFNVALNAPDRFIVLAASGPDHGHRHPDHGQHGRGDGIAPPQGVDAAAGELWRLLSGHYPGSHRSASGLFRGQRNRRKRRAATRDVRIRGAMKPSGPLLIAGGGTGGHLFPAIAVANAWEASGGEVVFVGTREGLESRLLPQLGKRLETLQVGRIKGAGFLGRVMTLLGMPLAIGGALRILWKYHPQAVLGVGGYASAPAVLAAWTWACPRRWRSKSECPARPLSPTVFSGGWSNGFC